MWLQAIGGHAERETSFFADAGGNRRKFDNGMQPVDTWIRRAPVSWPSIKPASSHITMAAIDGLADHRRHLVGDLDVPDLAFALRGEVSFGTGELTKGASA